MSGVKRMGSSDRLTISRPEAAAIGPAKEKTAQGAAPVEQTQVATTLPSPARRDLSGHLRALGLAESDPPSKIRDAELARAIALDPRVTARHIDAAIARAQRAEHIAPRPQVDLFGFTRLIDAKLALTPELVATLAERALDPRKGAGPRADTSALLEAIDHGPGGGAIAWRRPSNKVELVASLVRQLVLGQGASLHVVLSPALHEWLEGTVRGGGSEIREAMGGAGGFCANLGSALPNVESHFFSADDLPERVARRFSNGVKILDASGQPRAIADRTSASAAPRINFSAEYEKGAAFSVLGFDHLKVDGASRALSISGRGRVILGTQGTQSVHFAQLDEEALRRTARDHDLFFLVGTHHMTAAAPGAASEPAALARELEVMRRENPSLLVHLQYVVPKVPENEAAMLATLAGRFDSISLNSVELAGLLSRCSKTWKGDPEAPKEVVEKPPFILAAADALRAELGVSRVHIHGFMGDLLIQDRVKDPERQVLSLLRARQLSSLKAANDSGEIRSAADLVALNPIVEGPALAAVQSFADAIAARFSLDAAARAQVADRWWYRDPASDRTYFFVPSRGIHDATGGTISLGDTIDATALIHGLDPKPRARKLLHPTSF